MCADCRGEEGLRGAGEVAAGETGDKAEESIDCHALREGWPVWAERAATQKAERIRRLHEPPGPVDQVQRAAAHLAHKVTENAVLRLVRTCSIRERAMHSSSPPSSP